jgi:plastocyanin
MSASSWRRFGLTMLAAVLLAACGGQQPGQPTTSPPTSPPAPTTTALATTGTSSPGTGATTISVTETEFSIALPSTTLAPGDYRFVVRNDGQAPHDFAIRGPGVDAKSAQLGGGQQADVTVTLQPGSYEVWCTVGNHRQRGMLTTITVA